MFEIGRKEEVCGIQTRDVKLTGWVPRFCARSPSFFEDRTSSHQAIPFITRSQRHHHIQAHRNLSKHYKVLAGKNGERTRRTRRSVRFSPPLHLRLPQFTDNISLSLVTSPANAAPPTASSKPKTTPQCKSPSARSTRTGDTRARTRSMRSVGLCEQWASQMIASTASRRGMGI